MNGQKNTAPMETGRWVLKDILKRQPFVSWVAMLVSILALAHAITKP